MSTDPLLFLRWPTSRTTLYSHALDKPTGGAGPEGGDAAARMLRGLQLACPLLWVAATLAAECTVPIAGLFPMRRSPAGIQREAAARAAFCEHYEGSECTWTDTSAMTVTNSAGNLDITYNIFTTSSTKFDSDTGVALQVRISPAHAWTRIQTRTYHHRTTTTPQSR